RDRARGIEIVARAEFGIEAWVSVARAVVEQVGVGIVGGGLPDAAAADAPGIVIVLPGLGTGLAGRRDRERAPRQLTGVDVPGADPAPGAELSAGALALENQLLSAARLDRKRGTREALGPR